ncbi:hypothetical protein A3K01_02045 [candidate division WWE3 bacterium RIFOXYD1_FULL_43_17]|uniref:Uncharacterized protein n=3 Tax=Katanobacteria TaxID=422282 RepID=A0A1F4XGY2_UNCKA|nr:MAG: hypothetical protein UU59_C0008G0006 [candidate division WWE3 bacterium GW2011_GWE1_41_27]KKS60164.1 MAG: hypothetical protein UV26_C0007G0006 [candidate division WWE3 bacterium GW2011_GWF2_42_42]OGC80888.1 MAG: hypothetical protein A3K01_02045 [candidate division WWE3 bacterium RIFOXYD1_FULL_43_17]
MGGYLLVGFLVAFVMGYLFKWKIIRWLLLNLIIMAIIVSAAGSYLSKFFEVDYTSGIGEALGVIFGVAGGNILGAIVRALADRTRKTKNTEKTSE